ncbi:MAG: hypothetical protein ABI837_12220, partial [Acidobacteriota bacterium]
MQVFIAGSLDQDRTVEIDDSADSMPVSADTKPAEVGEPFKLPNDLGGKALARVLPPARRPGVLT